MLNVEIDGAEWRARTRSTTSTSPGELRVSLRAGTEAQVCRHRLERIEVLMESFVGRKERMWRRMDSWRALNLSTVDDGFRFLFAMADVNTND